MGKTGVLPWAESSETLRTEGLSKSEASKISHRPLKTIEMASKEVIFVLSKEKSLSSIVGFSDVMISRLLEII